MARLLAAALAAAAATSATAAPVAGSVYFFNAATSKYSFSAGVRDPAAAAYGSYLDWQGTKSGFGQLNVTTNASYADGVQMFAAGFLEGALTQQRIYDQAFNVLHWIQGQFSGGVIPPEFPAYFAAQDEWTRGQIAANNSAVWTGIGLITAQFDGLVAGYASVAPTPQALDLKTFQYMNAIGDFLDLIPALASSDPKVAADHDWLAMDQATFARRLRETTHCSALVKTDATYSDLWFSHVAWFAFSTTVRIWKNYNFRLQDPIVAGQQMSFSSYPAYLSSLDDFYSVWSSGLAVLETTNSVFNKALYKLITPSSLFAWQRVRNANLLARGGREWNATFGAYNSGTYNNQYIVVDVGLFKPGAALLPDTLWVVEQIPGLVVGGDVTPHLERGHWPSYNVAFWPEIYTRSGYPELLLAKAAQAAGELGLPPPQSAEEALRAPLGELAGVSYQLAPRAQIFRRDAGKVNDTASFLSLMRSNGFKTGDPLSKGSPWNAICSRGDLSSNPSPDGCYDGKAGTYSNWAAKTSWAVSGPTTAGGTLPPFAWSQFPTYQTMGLPAVYNFDWDTMVGDFAA